MAAAQYNFEIEQGSTLSKILTYKDATGAVVDLTGYEARMQMRATAGAVVTLLDLTSDPSVGIVIDGPSGQITITVSPADTANIPVGGVYDLELIAPGGAVIRLLRGIISLSAEVTR